MTAPDFHELMCAAKGGNSHALGRLLQLTRPLVMRVVYAHVGARVQGDVSPEDLAQDIFLRITQKLAKFNGDDWTTYQAWVSVLATNVCRNSLKKEEGRGRHTSLQADGDGRWPGGHEPKAPGKTPSSEVRRREAARRLMEAIASIPDYKNRAIIELRDLDGKPFTDIAALLGLTYRATLGRYRRTKKFLEEKLKELR